MTGNKTSSAKHGILAPVINDIRQVALPVRVMLTFAQFFSKISATRARVIPVSVSIYFENFVTKTVTVW